MDYGTNLPVSGSKVASNRMKCAGWGDTHPVRQTLKYTSYDYYQLTFMET